MPRELTPESARATIEAVVDPVYAKPLGELGVVHDVRVKTETETETEAGVVSASITVYALSDSKQKALSAAIDAALSASGAASSNISFQFEAPMRRTSADDPVPGVRNVVLVMSGKGGVGKSTCAANVALALSRLGARVGLLDADIYGPSVPTMLGVSGHPHSVDGKKIEPLSRFGVKLMSIGFLMEDPKAAIVWRGPMLHGALQQFLQDVRWGELDYLVVDLPPGTGDVALSLAQKMKVTGAVIVTTPQEVALQDVYKGVSMCEKLNVPVLGVVENMSFFIDSAGVKHFLFGEGGGQRIAEFAKAPLIGQIPLEPKVREWGDNGTPIVQAIPQSESAQAFMRIADALTEIIAKRHFERRGGDKAPTTSGPRRLKIVR
jgi:ATP-binding protein involved in chromosome partitioning